MIDQRKAIAASVLSFLLGADVYAQDDFFGSIDVDVDHEQRTSDPMWSYTGWLRQKAAYGLQAPPQPFSRTDRDWSKLETSFFLQFDAQLSSRTALRLSAKSYADSIYRLKGEENYSRDEVRKFKSRFEMKDAYVESQLNERSYIKLGQQIIAWGQAENLRITDLVNTQDLYTFGQQDLEDLRLPVPALRWSYRLGDALVDSVITYRAGHDYVAPALDEFDPLISLRSFNIRTEFDRPERETEYFVRVSGHYARGDWSVVAADANQNSADVRAIAVSSTPGIPPLLTLSQDRFQALGVAGNWTRGSWLAFAETGLHRGKRLQPNANSFFSYVRGWPEKDRVLSAVGLEYNGWSNTTVTAEFDHVHTRDFDNSLTADADQLGYSVRVLWSGFNERLQTLTVWNQLPDHGGGILRFSLDYDWSDSLKLGLLWVNYTAPRDAPLYPYRANDVLQLQIEYSFQR